MPYRTIDDKIDGFVLTFTNITASKQLEAALRGTSLMFKSLIHSAVGAIISISKDGIIIGLNSIMEKIYDIKYADLTGKDYFDMLIPLQVREKVRADIKTVLDDGLPVQFETTANLAGGALLKAKWQASKMIDDNGVVTGVIIVGLEVEQNEK
jgi:two-component system CheB/CheR fusion protein